MTDETFQLRTGKIALGDPTMGFVDFDVQQPPGSYRLLPGALCEATSRSGATIRLDGPYIFVVDSEARERFSDWFHSIFEDCGFDIVNVVQRLSESTLATGVKAAFYWEGDLTGAYDEGSYSFDPARIEKCS